MKKFLKDFGKYLLVLLVYAPAVILWILFVPFFKLLKATVNGLGFRAPGRWRWLGVEVDEA